MPSPYSPPAVVARRAMLASLAILLWGGGGRAWAHDLPTAGHVEWAWFSGVGVALSARLDTGAATSSIDARGIETFARDGRPWVRFTVPWPTAKVVERPRLRIALVNRSGTEVQYRPVVSLRVCVGGQSLDTEFTLNDRTGMGHPVLIGRSFLAGRFLVDAGASEQHAASACQAVRP